MEGGVRAEVHAEVPTRGGWGPHTWRVGSALKGTLRSPEEEDKMLFALVRASLRNYFFRVKRMSFIMSMVAVCRLPTNSAWANGSL